VNLKGKIFNKINDREFNPKKAGYIRFIYCEVNEPRVCFPKPARSTYYILPRQSYILDRIVEGEEILPAEVSENYIEKNLNDIFANIEHIKENVQESCRQCYLWLYHNNATDRYSLAFCPVL
jgi:hypothetical protein